MATSKKICTYLSALVLGRIALGATTVVRVMPDMIWMSPGSVNISAAIDPL